MENDIQAEPDFEKTFKSILTVGYLTSTSVIAYGLVTYIILKNLSLSQLSPENAVLFRLIFIGLGLGLLGSLPFIKSKLLKISEAEVMPDINKKLQSAAVIIFGLCETIAVLGVILAVLTKNIQDYYWLGLVSFAAFFYNFPKYEQWQEYSDNLKRF